MKSDKIIDALERRISHLNKKRYKIPAQGKTRTSKRAFVRLFVPDTHGHSVDKVALSSFLADAESLKPREVFLIGDHLDCSGWLSPHHPPTYISETKYTFENDVDASNVMLDELQAKCPKASMKYCEGNHESRLSKIAIAMAMKNPADSHYLFNLISPEAVLHLEKRKIDYIHKDKFYDGCRTQGTVKVPGCFITHGTRHGKNAASAMLTRFGSSVVFGHVHKLMSVYDKNADNGEMGAFCCGYLGDPQPKWRHGDPVDWTQGYMFQIVQPNGSFLSVHVPIIDGKSYLGSLRDLIG